MKAPCFSLVVLIAVQPPALNPFPVNNAPLVHGGDAHVQPRSRCKHHAESFAQSHELVRPAGKKKSIAVLRVSAEDLVKCDVHGVPGYREVDRGMAAVQLESMQITRALVLQQHWRQGRDGMVALG